MQHMHMPSAAASSTAASTASARQPGTIEIKNFAFVPSTMTVKVGTTVTWMNLDTDAHTVTSQHVGPLHSPALSTGQRFSFTFTEPGTFAYYCMIHPFMTATVTVTR
jgi:plastocyanin